MDRRLWCVFVLALLVSASFHLAEARKKKKKAGKIAPVVKELPVADEEQAEGDSITKSGRSDDVQDGGGDSGAESAAESGADEASASDKASDGAEGQAASASPAKEDESAGSEGSSSLAWRASPRKKDDIDPKGPCKRDIKLHCKGLTPGESVLALCLTFHLKNEKSGNEIAGIPVSKKCRKDIRRFRTEMYKDLTMDKSMESACKADIKKYCDDDFLYPEPGNIVACLREVNEVEKLADACKAEVLRAKMDAADDFKMDPQLNELCSGEAERLCKGVEPGEGRVQDCLREHRTKLAWDCQAELFRQEVENADDIRLNVRLFQACLNDQRKFCADVKYGDARVKDCLETHRLDPEFSPGCKTEFDNMMARRATDFRLDSKLRKYCKADIAEICYPDAEDISDVANYDAKVIECLQDYRDELKDPKCRDQVHKLTERAAEDIRFDKPLADACHADRITVCKDVPDGMAQVFMCLQEHMQELKESCRSAVFEQLVRMAEDIDFKFPLKRSCSAEMDNFCKDVPHGHAARVKCLQDNIDNADMGEECRKEVQRDMRHSAEDYRLNYRLHKACLPEIQKLCLHACDDASANGSTTCGGTVLKCLQEKQDQLESEACKQEVVSFNIMVARDPLAFDLPLQKACKADLTQHCPDVGRDHSRMLACLRTKRDELSQACKDEELRFSIMEASDIRLTPSLMNACGQELQSYCRDVSPTEGHAFKCLQEHLQEVGMGAACKAEVNLQEARHASNYRLDVRVHKECEADVKTYCDGVDAGKEGHALVLKCMVDNFKSLSSPCQSEVSYAVRMALFQYHRGAELTKPCDEVVEQKCKDGKKAKEVGGAVVGVFGQCLLSQKGGDLPEGCSKLVKVVGQEGAHVGGVIDSSKLDETLRKLEQLKSVAESGEAEVDNPHGGLVLTGWVAFAAIVSVAVVLVAAGIAIYFKYVRPDRNYTLVVKSAPGSAAV